VSDRRIVLLLDVFDEVYVALEDRTLLNLRALKEHATDRLGRSGGGGRRGRLGDRRAAGIVLPQGEGGADDTQGGDHRDREAGAGREEVPEPAGRCRRHDSTGLHGGSGPPEGTSPSPELSVR